MQQKELDAAEKDLIELDQDVEVKKAASKFLRRLVPEDHILRARTKTVNFSAMYGGALFHSLMSGTKQYD